MIIKAKKKWNIDNKKSFMIGDKKIDLLAAKNADLKFYYKSKKKTLYFQIKDIISKNLFN